MLPHEKLQVYEKALACVTSISGLSADWNKRHAVVDHLARAGDSVILNLVEGARLRSAPGKLKALDYALGSALECAAGLDIAHIKHLLSAPIMNHEKKQLSEVVKMLVGLRKAWAKWEAHEDPSLYRAQPAVGAYEPLFHHESLEVYAAGLELMAWMVSLPGSEELAGRVYCQIDQNVTSLILNIAEGNGRYSELDHRRFLDIAEGCAARAAAYLDLAVRKRTLSSKQCDPGKALLERIVAMLSRM